MIEIVATVPGKPVPKKRPRQGAGGRFYTPEPTRRYERTVAARSLLARQERYPGTWPLDAKYDVAIVIVPADRRRFDGDNVVKSLLDGAIGVLWRDDSSVIRHRVDIREPSKDAPHVVMRVRALDAHEAYAIQSGRAA